MQRTEQVRTDLESSYYAAAYTGSSLLGVIQLDPWLEPFKDVLRRRFSHAQKWLKDINEHEGDLDTFSRGYQRFGLNVNSNGDILYREWAPNATSASLMGDFSMFIGNLSVRS